MAPAPDPIDVVPAAPEVVGAQHRGTIEDHEARSALRALVALVLEALDAGDARAFAACFVGDGRWTDPSGSTTAAGGLEEHLARWRRYEPWSVHWASNEGVSVAGGDARGTWLWSAASAADGGRVPLWSAGDLSATARRVDGGWRLVELATSDRYRTSWAEGWLVEPMRPIPAVPARDPDAAGEEEPPPLTGVLPGPVPESWSPGRRLRALGAEVSVRNAVATLVGALERADLERVAAALAPGARLREADGRELTGAGLLAALERDAAEGQGLMRATSSWWCVADGVGRAGAGWRELATVVVDGVATWTATGWTVEAVEDDEGWHLLQLARRELLRTPYLPPWSVGPAEVVAP